MHWLIIAVVAGAATGVIVVVGDSGCSESHWVGARASIAVIFRDFAGLLTGICYTLLANATSVPLLRDFHLGPPFGL